MRLRFTLAALAASLSAQRAAAQTCSVPAKTLTSDCGSACAPYEPCMLNATASSPASACALECFTIDPANRSAYTNFTFMISFGSETVDTKDVAFKGEDLLTNVAKLTLPSTTTNVTFRGGTSLKQSNAVRARVAQVEFASNFLTANTQVTSLVVDDLNLTATIDTLAANFPPQLTELWLENDLIRAFPASITSLKSLTTLGLSNNYITQVNASHEMSQLEELHLDLNAITTFTAVYPKLTTIDVSNNLIAEMPAAFAKLTKLQYLVMTGNTIKEFKQEHVVDTIEGLWLDGNVLTAFDVYFPNLKYLSVTGNNFKDLPSSIFKHAELKELFFSNNKQVKNVLLTNEQANFLYTLQDFTADTTVFSTACDASQQTVVHNFTVCITGGPVNLGVITGPRPAATPAPATGNTSGKNTSSNGNSTGSNMAPIILGCVAGVVFVALLVGGYVYWTKASTKKQNTRTKSTNTRTNSTIATGSTIGKTGVRMTLWSDPDLLAVKVSSDDVEDIRKVAQGASSDVWLVRYRNTQILASKRVRDVTMQRTQAFIEEIKIVAALNHPRIVEFVGAAWTKEADLQALFEFMDGGDLRSYLISEHTQRQWTLEKIQIAIDITEALVYAHSFNLPLVHRDLKSRNVLLSGDLRAKLTDFGVSRFQTEQNTMTAGVGTTKWLAPEVISGSSDYGPAADIFSFGVVLSELDSHNLPYEDLRNSDGRKIADIVVLDMVATGVLKPSFLSTSPPEILSVAELCLALQPEARPTAVQIAYKLRTLYRDMGGEYAQTFIKQL